MGLALNCTQPAQSRGSEHQNKNIKKTKEKHKITSKFNILPTVTDWLHPEQCD